VWHHIWVYVLIFTFLHLTRFFLLLWDPSGPSCVERKTPFNVNLPHVTMTDQVEDAPVITIGRSVVALEKDVIGRIDKPVAEQKDLHDRLRAGLESLKKEYETQHPNQQFPARVIIAADNKVPFVVIRRVLDVCTTAGYHHFDLAVTPAQRSPR
jgi:biopolymer transport protein ExbD